MSADIDIDPSRSRKSESAFRTISEVAGELDVPQHALRFWESKFSQVKPLKRGGGRRYYRPEDVGLLKRIRDLLYRDGLTIKGVQKLFRDHGVKTILDGSTGLLPSLGSKAEPAEDKSSAFDSTQLIAELTDLRDSLRTALSARA